MRLTIKITATLLMLAPCFVVPPARAQWVPGGFTTSTNFPVSDGSGGLICGQGPVTKRTAVAGAVVWTVGPSITPYSGAADGSGGIVFAATGGINGDIFAQRINSAGGSPWGVLTICNAPNAQNQPYVATDAAGNTFIVWHDERSAQGTNQFFAQKLNAAGVPQWTANGVQVIPTGDVAYTTPTAAPVPDEAGGCYFIWEDSRPGTLGVSDLYAQRINSAGTVAWTSGGLPVCVAAGQQFFTRAIRDGSGGMIAVWMDRRNGSDFDLYAQRVDANGNSLWTTNGVAIATGAGDQNQEVMVEDGSGGAFVVWTDARNSGVTGTDIYAQHFDGTGAALWTANGLAVASTPAVESNPNIFLDVSGGVITAWQSGPTTTLVQRLSLAGAPMWEPGGVDFSVGAPVLLVTDGVGGAYIAGSGGGLNRVLPNGEQAWVQNYRATISSIVDVAGDEGGWVWVNVNKPLSDGGGLSTTTTAYSLWRKEPGGASAARLSDPAGLMPEFKRVAESAKYSDFPAGHWNLISYTPSSLQTYTLLTPTHTDSTAQGSASDSFVVAAHTNAGASIFVVSPQAGGHSVDNLAPGAPQNFAGGYAGGTTVRLHWSPNSEADLWHYSIYKGTSSGFVPSVGNRIGQPMTASLQDDAYEPGVSYYKASAIDRHGNESGFTLLSPSQITSVPPGTVPARSYLSRSAPNPFVSETAIEYGLAHDAKVSLVIYDLRGRRIARLVDGLQAAGVRKVVWSGLDDNHRLAPAGVYLLRFATGDVAQNEKIVRTH